MRMALTSEGLVDTVNICSPQGLYHLTWPDPAWDLDHPSFRAFLSNALISLLLKTYRVYHKVVTSEYHTYA